MTKATWADVAALLRAQKNDTLREEMIRQDMKRQQSKHTGFNCPICGQKLYEDGPLEYCLECGYKMCE